MGQLADRKVRYPPSKKKPNRIPLICPFFDQTLRLALMLGNLPCAISQGNKTLSSVLGFRVVRGLRGVRVGAWSVSVVQEASGQRGSLPSWSQALKRFQSRSLALWCLGGKGGNGL